MSFHTELADLFEHTVGLTDTGGTAEIDLSFLFFA